MHNEFFMRNAAESDAAAIAEILLPYAEQKILLARDEDDIRHYIANFIVAESEGKVIGCVAVRDFGNSLFEVRSLAVREEFQKYGIGRELIAFAKSRLEKRMPGGFRLFTLTLVPGFFEKAGFVRVEKEMFPEKIWSDCSKCAKLNSCDEVALLFER